MESMHQELQALKARLDTQDEEIKYLRLKVAKEELLKVAEPELEQKAEKAVQNYMETPEAKKKIADLSPAQPKTGIPEGGRASAGNSAESATPGKGGFLEVLHKPFEWTERPEPMIKVGRGSLNIGGLLQGWFTHDELTSVKDEFRIRRAEIKLYGEILPKFKYVIMFDPAQRISLRASDNSLLRNSTDTSGILKDAYIRLGHLPHHELTVGQFLIPVGEEGSRPTAHLDFVERSIIGRTFEHRRDIGLMLKGDYGLAEYYLAGVNGEEANAKDLNNRKDYIGRLVLKPFNTREGSLLKGLAFGGSYYNGRRGEHETPKTIWAAEARYQWDKLALKAEYLTARDDDSTRVIRRPIRKDGWYAQAGYKFLKPLEGAARYEEFRPDTKLHGNEQRALTLGFNWFFDGHHTKFQFNYIRALGEKRDEADDQILSAIQVAF